MGTEFGFRFPAAVLLVVFALSLLAMVLAARAERLRARQRLQNVSRKQPGPDEPGPLPARDTLFSRQNRALASTHRYSYRRRTTALTEFLASGGFRRSLGFYMIAILMVGGLIGVGLWLVLAIGPMALALGVLLAGAGLYVLVKRSIGKNLKIIEKEFPAAIDIIVRGVRSGMPLNESIRLVAAEAHPLIAKEFTVMLGELAVGIPLSQCIHRLAERMPIPDIQFFVVVLGLQTSTGGSVANALESSAETIRSRRALRQKVIVMSNEARASAIIIGILPIMVMVIMSFTSPEYIGLLFSTSIGNVALVITAFWMLIGVMVMRSMINFDV